MEIRRERGKKVGGMVTDRFVYLIIIERNCGRIDA